MVIHSYPWYPADWRGSEAVMAMTMEERGLYHELLDHAWETGSLPTDEAVLRKIAQATEREWRRSWPKVRQQFVEHDGRLSHRKIDERRPELEAWHRSRRDAGRVGGLKRWGKPSDSSATSSASSSVIGSTIDQPVPVLNPSSSSSTSTEELASIAEELAKIATARLPRLQQVKPNPQTCRNFLTIARLRNLSAKPSDVAQMVFAMIHNEDNSARGGKGLGYESWGGVFNTFKASVVPAEQLPIQAHAPDPPSKRTGGGMQRAGTLLDAFLGKVLGENAA
jgi:uncharacterized protein YdaU (DUF1376 family)